MNWIIDLILLAIVVVSTIVVAKKGFVKTVFNLVGFILAIALSLSFCEPVAEFFYDKVAEPAIHESIENAVKEELSNKNSDIDKKIQESSLPEFVKEKLSGINFKSFGKKSDDIADAICQKVVEPITVGFIKAIAFLILFIILSIIAKFLATAVNKICSFSIVGKTNKFLGGVLGFVFGLALAAVFIALFEIVFSLSGGFAGITQDTLNSTYIYKNALAALPFNVK